MPPVVSIVGKSESGKTTLIEKLIPPFKGLGYRIGVVKHAHHGFEMDHPGKDSYRHRQAGADTVMVASPDQIAMIKNRVSHGLAELIPFFSDVDLIMAEGFKSDHAPKIEIFRSERHRSPACLQDQTLIAMVSDVPLDVNVPQFTADQVDAIVQFIVQRFLSPP